MLEKRWSQNQGPSIGTESDHLQPDRERDRELREQSGSTEVTTLAETISGTSPPAPAPGSDQQLRGQKIDLTYYYQMLNDMLPIESSTFFLQTTAAKTRGHSKNFPFKTLVLTSINTVLHVGQCLYGTLFPKTSFLHALFQYLILA